MNQRVVTLDFVLRGRSDTTGGGRGWSPGHASGGGTCPVTWRDRERGWESGSHSAGLWDHTLHHPAPALLQQLGARDKLRRLPVFVRLARRAVHARPSVLEKT